MGVVALVHEDCDDVRVVGVDVGPCFFDVMKNFRSKNSKFENKETSLVFIFPPPPFVDLYLSRESPKRKKKTSTTTTTKTLLPHSCLALTWRFWLDAASAGTRTSTRGGSGRDGGDEEGPAPAAPAAPFAPSGSPPGAVATAPTPAPAAASSALVAAAARCWTSSTRGSPSR